MNSQNNQQPISEVQSIQSQNTQNPRQIIFALSNQQEIDLLDVQLRSPQQYTICSLSHCILLADQLRAIGYLDISLDLYTDLQALFPKSSKILAKKGLTHLRCQQFQEAIKYFQKSMQYSASIEQKLSSYKLKADAYYINQKYNKALKIYSQILNQTKSKNFNQTSEIFYRKGLCYMALNRYKKAIQQFSSACINKHNYGQAYFMKGNCFFALKNYNVAIKHFNQAALHNLLENVDLLTMKGLSHYNLEQYDQSKVCFQNAIDLDQQGCKYLKVYLTLIKVKEQNKNEIG